MKKTIVYAVIISVVSVAAGAVLGVAVEHRNAMERRQRLLGELRERSGDKVKRVQHHQKQLIDNLAAKLNLTDDQKEKVKAVLQSSSEEIATARKEIIAKIEAVRDSTNERIQETLNSEQKAKFRKIMDELKERGGRGKWFRGPPAGLEPPD